MERHTSDARVPQGFNSGKNSESDMRSSGSTAGKYLDKLTKALPGTRAWSGSKAARDFWPEGAKFVISMSLQFTAGASAHESVHSGNSSDISQVSSEEQYGWKEGIPRLLEIFQRRRVRVTSHMSPEAVEMNPQVAKEITQRGHEAAVYAMDCVALSTTAQQHRAYPEFAIRTISRVTGSRPVGFYGSSCGLPSNMLGVLQELGFLYHEDDLSRDEPFLISVRNQPFVVIPHALALNDRVAYGEWHQSTDQYACELKNAFEILYAEAETRRRMMSISAHDFISGRPARAKVLEEFIVYAQRRPGVAFLRKDEIARFALASPITPREEDSKRALEAA